MAIAGGKTINTSESLSGSEYNIYINGSGLTLSGVFDSPIKPKLLMSIGVTSEELSLNDGNNIYKYTYIPSTRQYQVMVGLENKPGTSYFIGGLQKIFAEDTSSSSYPFIKGNYVETGSIVGLIPTEEACPTGSTSCTVTGTIDYMITADSVIESDGDSSIEITFNQNCTTNGQIIYTDNAGIEIGRVDNTGNTVSGTPGNLTCSGHIVVCNGTQSGYILQACNLGAIAVGATNTSITAYGNIYQWGRNKAFPSSGIVTQQSTTIPGNINTAGDTYGFVWDSSLPSPYTWANSDISNNWGNTTNTSTARQGPCSLGYHIPSKSEWSVIILVRGLGSNNGTNLSNALKLPFSGRRQLTNGNIQNQGVSGYYWSSSYENDLGNYLYLDPTYINSTPYYYAATGYSVRCLKNN